MTHSTTVTIAATAADNRAVSKVSFYVNNVLKCTVYCTSAGKFAAVNTIYARYFPAEPPARVFVCVPAWPGTFDIEVDCVAAV